jgi:flagellar biosynthesis protein FlhF
MSMQEEVEHLKRMIGELKSAQDDGMNGSGAQVLMSQTKLNSPALQDAFEQLVINGMDKRFALQLIRAASFELGDQAQNPEAVADQLAAEIMSTTEISSALAGIAPGRTEGPAVLAVVGPTGVGKTTTVAKLASEAILRRNLRVGLINLDGYKVAAFDQLGTYAKILNVPFRSAATADDLRAAMADFKSLDLVLIDTTGRSQRDPGSLGEMQGMLATVPGARTHLVLSVTTRDNELYDMAHRFSVFRPEGLIVSKLDEGTIYGAIYNISQKAKLPLVYFTTGQRVPEDIEEATRERVAALVLDL